MSHNCKEGDKSLSQYKTISQTIPEFIFVQFLQRPVLKLHIIPIEEQEPEVSGYSIFTS